MTPNLLRLLLCRVPDKACWPYEWYAKLYQQCMPPIFLQIPCNHKLLCMHANIIPHALKWNGYPITPCSFRLRTRMPLLEETEIMCCKCCFQGRAQKAFHAALLEWGSCHLLSDQCQASNVLAILLPMSGQSEGHCFLQSAPEIILRLASLLLWCEERILPTKVYF